MTTVQDDILELFFREIGKDPAVNQAMVEALRDLLEGDRKPKVEDLVAAFAIQRPDQVL